MLPKCVFSYPNWKEKPPLLAAPKLLAPPKLNGEPPPPKKDWNITFGSISEKHTQNTEV